jgi:hypothetical protein
MPLNCVNPPESPFAPSKQLAVPAFDRAVEWSLLEHFRSHVNAFKKTGHTREVLAAMARILQSELMGRDIERFYQHSIMHPAAIEGLMRAVVGAIERPMENGYGYVREKASHATTCIQNWGPPKALRTFEDGPIPGWTSVDTGDGKNNGFDYLCGKMALETPNRFEYGVRKMARDFCRSAPRWTPMMLVMVTPIELELPDHTPYDVVCRKAHDEYGLAVCPPDTPVQLLAQRGELHRPPEGEARICTVPTPEGKLFSIKWGDGAPGAVLSWCRADPCRSRERLIFRRRWKSEDEGE